MAQLDEVIMSRMNRALSALSLRARLVAAYLFGSRVQGKTDEWSDYDLAVFIEEADQWDLPELVRFCAAIQKEAGDDIELHVFPASKADAPDKASFAEYIIKNGVRLDLEHIST